MSTDGEIALPQQPFAERQLPIAAQRLAIEDTGYYATLDEQADAIRIFDQSGAELFALSRRAVAFESKPLFLFLQVHLLGVKKGRAAAQQETKAKIEKITELIKMCI